MAGERMSVSADGETLFEGTVEAFERGMREVSGIMAQPDRVAECMAMLDDLQTGIEHVREVLGMVHEPDDLADALAAAKLLPLLAQRVVATVAAWSKGALAHNWSLAQGTLPGISS